MLVNLGKLLDGEEKSKKDDIDIGVHDESGALYTTFTLHLHYIYILTERPVVLSNAIFNTLFLDSHC